jgi:hypothetical protein
MKRHQQFEQEFAVYIERSRKKRKWKRNTKTQRKKLHDEGLQIFSKDFLDKNLEENIGALRTLVEETECKIIQTFGNPPFGDDEEKEAKRLPQLPIKVLLSFIGDKEANLDRLVDIYDAAPSLFDLTWSEVDDDGTEKWNVKVLNSFVHTMLDFPPEQNVVRLHELIAESLPRGAEARRFLGLSETKNKSSDTKFRAMFLIFAILASKDATAIKKAKMSRIFNLQGINGFYLTFDTSDMCAIL